MTLPREFEAAVARTHPSPGIDEDAIRQQLADATLPPPEVLVAKPVDPAAYLAEMEDQLGTDVTAEALDDMHAQAKRELHEEANG